MSVGTYALIETVTLGSTAASVTFSSIPQTYTDLIVVANIGIAVSDDYPALRVGNGSVDTGSNYSLTGVSGNGSSATSGRDSNRVAWYTSFCNTSNPGNYNLIFNLQDYANTTTFKSGLIRTNFASAHTSALVVLWRSTSAINTLQFSLFDGTGGRAYNTGSTFRLYGIQAGNQ